MVVRPAVAARHEAAGNRRLSGRPLSRRPHAAIVATVMAASLAGIAGCTGARTSAGRSTPASEDAATRVLHIAYLQKQADQQYFVDEAGGARAEAAKLSNVVVTFVDVGNDAATALTAFHAQLAAHVDAIAFVVPDQQIGPQVIREAKAAGIPLLASDDRIKDGNGVPAPFVGFDSALMGQKVGEQAGRLFKASGWSSADTRIVIAWKQDLSGCTERVDGAHDAFLAATGVDLPVVEIATNNTPIDAENKARAALAGLRAVQHWVVWGCNDENETGVVTALQKSGVPPSRIIGVGIGAYMTCKDWQGALETGNRAALYINGKDVGASAIDALVSRVRDGTDLPAQTIAKSVIVDRRSWQSAGVTCA